MAYIFNFVVESYPICYLGIPLRPGRPKRVDLLSLIEKIEKRLTGWKGKSLSLGGCLTLVNAVLSSIPIYLMYFYELPH